MNRREMLSKLTAIPILGGMVKDITEVGEGEVVILSLSPQLDPSTVEIDHDSLKKAFTEAFEAAGIKKTQVVMLIGFEAHVIKKS